MAHIFTPNHLILNLYREMPALETLELIEELESNDYLRNENQTAEEGQQLLPNVVFKPAEKTLQAILSYSKRAPIAQC